MILVVPFDKLMAGREVRGVHLTEGISFGV